MAMMRPETVMKDSGIKWVGLMPANWKTVRIKNLPNQEENSFVDGDWIESSYITNEGIRYYTTGNIGDGKFKEQGNGYISENTFNELKCKYAFPGDLVLSRLNEPYGRSCIIPETEPKCIVAVDNVILRTNEDKRYICYITQCDGYHAEVGELARGTAMKRVSRTNLGTIRIPLPSKIEQQAIADYLDETCSKIDEIIAEAKASINEYKELKQSVIFEAVTKGLDKNINVYKTGNSWIPLLPAGVKLSRFGLHHDIILGKMLCPNPRNEEDTLEPYYCAANVHFDGVTGELKTMWFNSKEKETYVVHKNDMLIVEGGAGAGGAAIMNEEPPVSTFVQNSIMIVRSHMKDNRYSCYLVQALVKNKYVDVVCNKATIPHFTKEKVSCMPYPAFNRNERNEIANYLDERCKQIDSLITEKEALINDLEAYKKSLIYEVVTGKRRVV